MAVGESDKASDDIAAALAALKGHSEDLRCSPYLARCLFLTGAIHAYGMQAVTAEGLFRAAIDKIESSPFATHHIG
jgi:hypothetical protein